MFKYTVSRIFQALLTLLAVSFIIFYAGRMMGSTNNILFTGEDATHIQYIAYMKNVFKGDLGFSEKLRLPVLNVITMSYKYTLIMAVGGMFFSLLIGVIFGIIAAVNQSRFIDHFLLIVSLFTASTPLFFISFMLIYFFSLRLGLFPSMGMEGIRGAVLPIVTLGLPAIGYFTRITRSAMVDALKQDYIRTSKSRGIPKSVIICIHAFRNSLIPIITGAGIRFGEILAGTILVENAFSIPGIGRQMITAISYRDYDLIQGCVLFLAAMFISINFIADLLYTVADPRVRLS